MARLLALSLAVLAAACAGGPEVMDWQLNASQAMQAFRQDYLVGDTAQAEQDFLEARYNVQRTGREDLLARLELVRCAVRVASLELDDCPGFEALRAGAGAEDLAYADYLAGKGAHKADDGPLSRLVASGVSFRTSNISPGEISAAVETASAQGWRRPLLAWLGVQAKRAADAGDGETAARLRRRMDLISK
jgi:hypothetical protein